MFSTCTTPCSINQGVIAVSERRKNRDAEDEEAELESSSEDEFYDRTEEGRRKKRGKEGNAALDAASLYGKKVGWYRSRFGWTLSCVPG